MFRDVIGAKAVDTALQKAALEKHKVGVTIVGPRWHSECHDVRDFLSRKHVEFNWLDPADKDAQARIPRELRDAPLYPVVLFEDGRRLIEPSLRALAEAVNLRTLPGGRSYLAIIGAGPAGLGAAVYGASEGLSTVIFERLVVIRPRILQSVFIDDVDVSVIPICSKRAFRAFLPPVTFVTAQLSASLPASAKAA